MSILSGYKKAKKYLKTTSGYSLISQWVSSQTVEMDDGTVLETKISDMDTEIDQKAESNSPTLTGSPQAPTAPAGNNSTQIATTAFVQNAVKDTVTENITAENIGALPISGGTLTGDLRIKNNTNYGTKINLGDNDYVHLHEYEDDKLEIKGTTIKLTTNNLYQNGERINLTDLKKSVSDGKSAVASAITDMGVSTSSDAAFSTMSSNIRNISKDASASPSDICSGKTAYTGGRKVTGTLTDLRSAGAIFIGQYFSTGGASQFAAKSIDNVCYNKFDLHYTINTYNWGSISEYGEWGCPHIVITGTGGNINVLRSNWSIDVTNYQKMVVQLYGTTEYSGSSMNLRGCIGIASPGASSGTGAEGRDYALRYGEYYFSDSNDHWKDVVVDLSGINQTVVFHMSTVHVGDIYLRTISFIPND